MGGDEPGCCLLASLGSLGLSGVGVLRLGTASPSWCLCEGDNGHNRPTGRLPEGVQTEGQRGPDRSLPFLRQRRAHPCSVVNSLSPEDKSRQPPARDLTGGSPAVRLLDKQPRVGAAATNPTLQTGGDIGFASASVPAPRGQLVAFGPELTAAPPVPSQVSFRTRPVGIPPDLRAVPSSPSP